MKKNTQPERAGIEGENKDEASTPEVMTVEEVAALLRVNRKTVYAAIKANTIPGTRKIGTVIRVSRDAVLRWMASGQTGVSLTKKGGA